jgi:hypothetical protein
MGRGNAESQTEQRSPEQRSSSLPKRDSYDWSDFIIGSAAAGAGVLVGDLLFNQAIIVGAFAGVGVLAAHFLPRGIMSAW